MQRRFGLIGNPINHSLSPALFRAAYSGKYSYDLIETDSFDEAYRRFLADYDGINITTPFKEQAFAKADIISQECRMIGAANLLVKTGQGVEAYNTDYYGVILSILAAVCASSDEEKTAGAMSNFPPRPTAEECAVGLKGRIKTALVVGLGGAGKAAAAAAARTLGLKTTLMNRTIEKAKEFTKNLPECGFRVRPMEEFAEAFVENDIIIYTIPYRIPQADSLLKDCSQNKKKYLLEANYRDPALSDLPATYISGRQWLLGQAYAGYDLFTGEVPDLEAMGKIIL